jgi:hypothetical protein
MPWADTPNRDTNWVRREWIRVRKYWRAQPHLLCSECQCLINTKAKRYDDQGHVNPRSLVVTHKISRQEAEELG